jgi:NAD(P)H-hydrate epimerase
LQAVTILEKGARDVVSAGSVAQAEIVGGNAGMTKGGTGDALAGLVAALYCTNDILVSAMWGSAVCKRAGDELYEKVGTFFNASDLTAKIPETFWEMVKKWRAV